MHIDADGRGIDDGALTPQPGHLGIIGMRERVLAIGAHWSVARNAGGGTTVSLHWDQG